MIVVTAAGGRTGTAITRSLSERGLAVRALVGSSWGFFALPDLSPRAARSAGTRATEIAQASAMVPGPASELVPINPVVASWASECEEDPLSVPLAEKGDLLTTATRLMLDHGADQAEGLYQIWDTTTWFVSSEGHRIDQRIRECGAGISATAPISAPAVSLALDGSKAQRSAAAILPDGTHAAANIRPSKVAGVAAYAFYRDALGRTSPRGGGCFRCEFDFVATTGQSNSEGAKGPYVGVGFGQVWDALGMKPKTNAQSTPFPLTGSLAAGADAAWLDATGPTASPCPAAFACASCANTDCVAMPDAVRADDSSRP